MGKELRQARGCRRRGRRARGDGETGTAAGSGRHTTTGTIEEAGLGAGHADGSELGAGRPATGRRARR